MKKQVKKQKFPHLLHSKWTATQRVLGWRHFQVINRKQEGSLVFAEMVAACDPRVRLWVNARTLKNRGLWLAGWQSLQEMTGAIAPGQTAPPAKVAPPAPANP